MTCDKSGRNNEAPKTTYSFLCTKIMIDREPGERDTIISASNRPNVLVPRQFGRYCGVTKQRQRLRLVLMQGILTRPNIDASF
ncbi:hypothetical protein NXS19_005950 [Fusarium pseudograminearum]|nr:hypothetical protein NXS19_005950 [Fusarium pseudograminearum]